MLLVPSLQIAPTRVVPVLPGHHGIPPGGLGGCEGVVGTGVNVDTGVGDALGVGVASRRTMGRYEMSPMPSALAGHAAVTIMLAQKIASAKMETIRFTEPPDSIHVNPESAGFVDFKRMSFSNQTKQVKHLRFTRELYEREFEARFFQSGLYP